MKIRIIICFSIFFSISGCSTYKERNNYGRRIEYTQDWENIKSVYNDYEDFCFAADSVLVNVRFAENKLSDRCFTSHEVKFIKNQVIENNSEFKFSPPYDLGWSGIDTIKNFYRHPCYGLYYYGFYVEKVYYRYLIVKSNCFLEYQTTVMKLPDTIVVWQKYNPEDSMSTRLYLEKELLMMNDSSIVQRQLNAFFKGTERQYPHGRCIY